jgi:Ni,Fe-hydrogenase III small subunit
MFISSARQKSVAVYHLHMGGPDAAAVELRALRSPRFDARLKTFGVRFVTSAWEADVMLITGMLLERNLDAVLRELASLPQPSIVIAAGDEAIGGGQWSKLEMPALAPYPLSHYADIQITVPGDPPTPQAMIAALAAAAETIVRPSDRIGNWQDD